MDEREERAATATQAPATTRTRGTSGRFKRRPLSEDERELVRTLPEDPNRDEKELLARVRAITQANGGGDPMNGRRTGLRCRFMGGTTEREETILKEVDNPDEPGTKLEVPVKRVIKRKVGPCDTLINVPENASEADVIIAIRARRAHEQGLHGFTP